MVQDSERKRWNVIRNDEGRIIGIDLEPIA